MAALIEDEELRAMFDQESAEHIDALESGILLMEKDPNQPELHNKMMREAHSLKGAARMLGLDDIEVLSHNVESLLRDQIDADNGYDTKASQTLFNAIDELRRLCAVAIGREGKSKEATPSADSGTVGGTGSDEAANTTSDQDQSVTTVATPQPEPTRPVTDTAIEQTPTQSAPKENQGTAETSPPESYRPETIRVFTDKLDRLLNHSGELQIVDKRLLNQARNLDEIMGLVENNLRLNQTLAMELRAVGQHPQFTTIGNISNKLREVAETLSQKLANVAEANSRDVAYLERVSAHVSDSVRDMRMLPLSVLFEQFRRMVRDIANQVGKDVELIIDGADVTADKRIIDELKDPLMHLLRNAIEHGIESPEDRLAAGKPSAGLIKLRGLMNRSTLMVEVEDDGRGLNLAKIREKALRLGVANDEQLASMTTEQLQNLIFNSGLSTQEIITDLSGRGVGLDVVKTMVTGLKGDIVVQSQSGQGTSFRLMIPQNFATTNVVLIRVKNWTFAVPVDAIQSLGFVQADAIEVLEGQASIQVQGNSVSLVLLDELLGLSRGQYSLHDRGQYPTVILSVEGVQLAVVVDEVMEEQSVVSKPLGTFIKRIRHLSGVCILGTGDIVSLLSPPDLITSVTGAAKGIGTEATMVSTGEQLRVLLAEDSMITRTQEKRMLESAGYEVIIAIDGQDAWTKLNSESVDAVVSDIMMPNMDGFELTQRIRADKRFQDLPVLLVTSLSSDADRQKGLDAGASAYISKGTFNQKTLLDALERLIGVNE